MNTLSSLLNFIGRKLQSTIPTVSVTASVGKYNSSGVRRYGNVVQLGLNVEKSTVTAPGSNFFEGTLNTADLLPATATRGIGYSGANSITATLSNTGAITIRNTGSGNLPANTPLGIHFVYIVD